MNKKIDYMYECFKRIIEGEKSNKSNNGKKANEQQGNKQKPNKHTGKKVSFYRTNIQRIIDEEPEWWVEKSPAEN